MITFPELRGKIRHIFHIDDSPHKIALAFAVGVFIAFSPTIGLHTATAVVLAWLFRLNLMVVILATLINNPWTITFIFGFSFFLGRIILREHLPPLSVEWTEITLKSILYNTADFWNILTNSNMERLWLHTKPFILPFVTGTILLGIIASVIAYIVVYYTAVLIQYEKKHLMRK
ncbi:MAG: DUF2062 domain-containing protein [Nitrospinota bacterium]